MTRVQKIRAKFETRRQTRLRLATRSPDFSTGFWNPPVSAIIA